MYALTEFGEVSNFKCLFIFNRYEVKKDEQIENLRISIVMIFFARVNVCWKI